jgi:hypothetical protein
MNLARMTGTLLLTAAIPAGCQTRAPAEPGFTKYEGGALVAVVDGSIDATLAASEGVVKGLGYTTRDRTRDALDARLVASPSIGPDVRIRMHSISPMLTEVRVRVGSLGNRDKSEMVLNRIQAAL